MGSRRPSDDETHAPVWAAVVTYVLCWSAGGFLIVTAMKGDWTRLAAAFLFIVWPASLVSPLELVKAWRGR